MWWRRTKSSSAAALKLRDEDPPSLPDVESLSPAEGAYKRAVMAVWSDDLSPVLPPARSDDDPMAAPDVHGLVHLHPGLNADPKSVFVVTPDSGMQDGIRADLEREDYHVHVFSRIYPMVDQWLDAAPGLIFLDADNDDRDALQVCRAIRRQPLLSHVSVVILSRKTDPETRRALFDAGANDWVALPFMAEEIVNRIGSLVERRRQKARREMPTATATRSTQILPFSRGAIRVLLADHDPMFRDLLSYHLTRLGWRVTTAQDGDKARKILRSDAFHVAILEAMLPFRDGFEILDDLRGPGRSRSMKVVLLSGQAPDVLQVRAFSQGADDFIAKPFNPEVAVSRLQRLVQMR